VQDGRVAGGIRNFRFNQSILEMLSNVEMLGPAVRAAGEESFEMVVPPMKVRDFISPKLRSFSMYSHRNLFKVPGRFTANIYGAGPPQSSSTGFSLCGLSWAD